MNQYREENFCGHDMVFKNGLPMFNCEIISLLKSYEEIINEKRGIIMKKVYCSKCKYYKDYYIDDESYIPDECKHKENVIIEKIITKNSYREAPSVMKNKRYNDKPSEINKNNDCKWFKKK